jgi:hypothetical protein
MPTHSFSSCKWFRSRRPLPYSIQDMSQAASLVIPIYGLVLMHSLGLGTHACACANFAFILSRRGDDVQARCRPLSEELLFLPLGIRHLVYICRAQIIY